jgi:hypothetical protein
LKKYFALAAITVGLMAIAFILPMLFVIPVESVEILTVQTTQHKEFITVSGIISNSSQENVMLEYPVITEDDIPKIGKIVEKGELLFKVNQEETVAAWSAKGYGEYAKTVKIPSSVISPCSGYIVDVNIKKGELFDPSVPAVVVANFSECEAIVAVAEAQISEIKVGLPATVSGVGFKDKTYEGTISSISSTATSILINGSAKTVVEVHIALKEPDDSLKHGFSATADILTQVIEDVVVLPYESIVFESYGAEYVYVINGKYAEKRKIEIEAETKNGCIVKNGVETGENIAADVSKLYGETVKVSY